MFACIYINVNMEYASLAGLKHLLAFPLLASGVRTNFVQHDALLREHSALLRGETY